jgi:hypothetical protein
MGGHTFGHLQDPSSERWSVYQRDNSRSNIVSADHCMDFRRSKAYGANTDVIDQCRGPKDKPIQSYKGGGRC